MSPKYPIVEIFTSIQGEGQHMGCKVTFVRFAGCNLSCEWCDTDFTEKESLTAAEIISRIKEDGAEMVVLTGGEPGLQNLRPLLKQLKWHDYFVAIETNGTIDLTTAYGFDIDWITCSPKPQNDYQVIDGLKVDELKYVVDEEFTVEKIPEKFRSGYLVWLQPEGNNMQASATRAYNHVMQHSWLRLGVQLHKIFDLK